MNSSRWISHNPKEFKVGDIICDTSKQSFLRLVVYIDDIAIWCVGLVQCSLTENNKSHPLFPIYFNEIENSEERLTKLGNLNDYAEFIKDIQNEVVDKIKKIDGYENINFNNSERININMAEKVAEAKILLVHQECENCNSGIMEFQKFNYYKDENGFNMVKDYHHKCNNCGFEKDFHTSYPYTKYVPVEELRDPVGNEIY